MTIFNRPLAASAPRASVVGRPRRGDSERPVAGESAGFAVREWLDGQEVIARIGATAASGGPGMTTGVQDITLALVMPEWDRPPAARVPRGGIGKSLA